MCPQTDEEQHASATLPYCAIVRKCMYLSNCTCPDISFTVQELAKFMSNYSAKHYKAVKHLLCYLQGTHGKGITYGNEPNPYPIFKSFAEASSRRPLILQSRVHCLFPLHQANPLVMLAFQRDRLPSKEPHASLL